MASGKISHSVSFIVPAFNEEQVVESVVRSIWATVDSLIVNYEIILIDDGSADSTAGIMDRLAQELPKVRVLHNRPNIGLGASYKRGVAESKLDYVMMLCGDGGLPASSLPLIVQKIGTADIVIPYMTNFSRIKTPTRRLISYAYTFLLNLISGNRLNYYNGLPVHRRGLLSQIEITSSGFGFQGEILIKLIRNGCSYVQVGVQAAEATNKSSALRLRNVVSVAKTFLTLLTELRRHSRKAGRLVQKLKDERAD